MEWFHSIPPHPKNEHTLSDSSQLFIKEGAPTTTTGFFRV
jgi:hypothetical protein